MERNVFVSIKGLHQFSDGSGEDADVELVTPGKYYKRNGKEYIAYTEQYSTDSPSHSATVKVEPDSLMISTRGEMGGQLHFEPGKRNLTIYQTPYGAMQMGITTQALSMHLEEHNWEIDVDYTVDINNLYSGDHAVHISVQDGKGENRVLKLEK